MKVDTSLSGRIRDAADEPAAAERLGYDGAWSSELNHDPFLPLVPAAEASQTIELGTSIVVAFARSPMTTAQVAWDLQSCSGGRMVLGLGSQIRAHIEKRFSMPWSRPAARMQEFVLALRAIWDAWQNGTPLAFRGDFYQHTLMTPMFDPGPLSYGPPKVLVAAVGPEMTKVAAEVADGVMLHAFTTDRYVRDVTLPAIETGLSRSGRSREEFTVQFTPFVATGRDDAEIAEAVLTTRQRIAFYGSTPAYRPVLDAHGWGDLQPELHRMSKEGRWADMADLVDDDLLDAFAVVGTFEAVADGIVQRVSGVADRTTFQPPPGLDGERVRRAIDEIRGA